MIPGAAVTEPATRATSRRHCTKQEVDVSNVSKRNTQETILLEGLLLLRYIGFETKCGSSNIEQVSIALTLLACIREVLGSNIGRNVGYPDGVFFSWLFIVSSGKFHDFNWILPRPFPSKYFPLHISSYHSTLYSLDAGSVVK
jgi:hypothetical protein